MSSMASVWLVVRWLVLRRLDMIEAVPLKSVLRLDWPG
jgi:hypothetical protein